LNAFAEKRYFKEVPLRELRFTISRSPPGDLGLPLHC
jgi:hypothetical protein